MSKQSYIKVGDLVRPRNIVLSSKEGTIWQVTEVSEFGFTLTAHKLNLEPKEEWHKVTGMINEFTLLKKAGQE